jgi:hypothetical protein
MKPTSIDDSDVASSCRSELAFGVIKGQEKGNKKSG